MTYITGTSKQIQGLLDALDIKNDGIISLTLNIEAQSAVSVTTCRLVKEEELVAVTRWVLKSGVQAAATE